jgi:hypothetical protein
MANQPRPGDEPVLTVPDQQDVVTGDEVPEADAAEQGRDARPAASFEAPALDGEVGEYDALEQARVVGLDEDEEGHDVSAGDRFEDYPG